MSDIQGPFTDLRTFLNGGISDINLASTAAIAETKLAPAGNGLAKGTFSVYRNAAVSLVSGAAIVFDTEEFDVSGWHDVTTGRYTPQVAGYYRLSWSVEVGILAADVYFQANLFKNGTLFKGGSRTMQRGSGAGPVSTGSHPVVANGTTDFYDVRLFHNAGSAVALTPGPTSIYFGGELIGRS